MDLFAQDPQKTSFSNPSTKKKSFLSYKDTHKQKLLLPKNHRKVYESFKFMLKDYDREDAVKILSSLMEELNLEER